MPPTSIPDPRTDMASAPLNPSRAAAARRFIALLAAGLLVSACQAFTSGFGEFGGERVRNARDRAAQRDAMLELRLELLLPRLMQESGFDCWLLLADGADGDPLFAMLTVSRSRLEGKGALLLCAGAEGVSRSALGRGLATNAPLYEVVEPSAEQPLENLLNARLVASAPERIAVNDARTFAASDGLSASNARWLRDNLAADFVDRLLSSRRLAEDFLATQLDVEAPLLAESARLAAGIIEQVLSDRVVVAAGTSLADLDWAVRERTAAIGVDLAFPPRTIVYRLGADLEDERRMEMDLILQPGDLVFLSAGIRYMGYGNRIGRWAYLMRTGERQAPDWANASLAELALAAERAAAALDVGMSEAEALAVGAAVTAHLEAPRVSIDRVARMHEGALAPWRPAAAGETWGPEYRLAADTGLALTVEATITPPGTAAEPFTMLSLDTLVLTVAGARFVVPPQQTPLLID